MAQLAIEALTHLATDIPSNALREDTGMAPKDISVLARALRDLTSARQSLVSTKEMVRDQVVKEASERMEKVIQSQGLSIDVATALREAMTQ